MFLKLKDKYADYLIDFGLSLMRWVIPEYNINDLTQSNTEQMINNIKEI